jgi:protein phosphatase 1 regulatory subunit 11
MSSISVPTSNTTTVVVDGTPSTNEIKEMSSEQVSTSTSTSEENIISYRLRIRRSPSPLLVDPNDAPDSRVRWQEGVIDNEHLNKKSSKKCCIFTKKRAFDESSSEESEEERHQKEVYKRKVFRMKSKLLQEKS